jgi:predicted RNA-binding protein with RPS1 domain
MEELKDSGKGDVKKRFPKGQEIQVEIISIDAQEKIRLSQRVMEEGEDRESYREFLEKDEKNGKLGTFGDILKNVKVK